MRFGAQGLTLVLFLSLVGIVGCGGGDETAANGDKPAVKQPKKQPEAPQRPSHIYPRVVVSTNLGELVVELDAEKAPITVQNFLDYVDSGHYDNTIFHHVVSGQIVLGGGFTPELKRKEERTTIYNEADNGLKNLRGTIAMARLPHLIDSATCQFFINVGDNAAFDHQSREGDPEEYGYCVFGRVIKGMELVDKLANQEVAEKKANDTEFPAVPTKTVRITTIRRY